MDGNGIAIAGPVLAVALWPTPAEASLPDTPPSCTVSAASMPQSGVTWIGADVGASLALVFEKMKVVEATWADGTVVPGQLHLLTLQDVDDAVASPKHAAYWRPEAPLERAEPLSLHLEMEGAGACAPISEVLEIEVVEDPVEPFVPAEAVLVGIIDPLEPACCDGAFPTFATDDSLGLPDGVSWDEGYCVLPRTLDEGYGRLQIEGERPGPLPNQWIARLWDGDELLGSDLANSDLWFDYQRPFSTRIEYEHLGTGEIVLGPELAVPGEVSIDTATPDDAWALLQDHCEGAPYRCGVRRNGPTASWVEDHCSEVGPENLDPAREPDAAGGSGASVGCSLGGTPAPSAALFILTLAALGRRRR